MRPVQEGLGESAKLYTFNSSSTWFGSACWNGTVRIWDIHTGKVLQTLESQNNSWTSCAFSSDGTWLTTASWEGSLKIWEIYNETVSRLFMPADHLSGVRFALMKVLLLLQAIEAFIFLTWSKNKFGKFLSLLK